MSQLEQVFEGNNVRIVLEDDKPLFHLGDVLKAVESKSEPSHAKKSIDPTDLFTKQVSEPGGRGVKHATFISELGLIELLGTLRVPKTKEFRRWIFREVIPTVLKTGKYEVESKPAPTLPQITPTREMERMAMIAQARDLGFISEAHANAQGQIQLSIGLGQAPAIEETFIYTEQYLIDRGCPKAFAKRYRSPFGTKIAKLYRARYGEDPQVHQDEMNRKIMNTTKYYTPKDKDLLDQTFEEYIQPKLEQQD